MLVCFVYACALCVPDLITYESEDFHKKPQFIYELIHIKFRSLITYYIVSYIILTFGSHLWSAGGETDRWRHYYKHFPFVFFFFKWWKVLTNKIISYLPGQRKMYKKSFRGCEQLLEAGRTKKTYVSSKKKIYSEKYLSSLSRARLNEKQNGSWNNCFASYLTNPKSKIFMTLVYQNIFFLNHSIIVYTDWCHEFTI